MNADRLLEHYARFSESPDAITRLRRFILDLAVRGKLVEQDAADEPASVLLKWIATERSGRLERGEIRRGKPLEPIDDTPFAPPNGWAWIPLGTTGNIFTGNSINAPTRETLEKTKEGRPFIATKDVGYGLDEIGYNNGLFVDFSAEKFKIARAHTVLICAEGGSAGKKIGLTDRKICFGNKLLANETWSVVLPKFVRYVYMSELFFAQFCDKMTGVIGGISIKNFLQLPFPLPPLAEQHRIVAKVDELMALCDRLERARMAREAVRDRLTIASLARLTEPDATGADFQSHARFALQSLTALTTRPDQIKPLRQTILNLAFRGKLVNQDPAEGTGDDLMKVVSYGSTVRKVAASPDLTLITFEIPETWSFRSLSEIAVEGPKNGLSPTKTERSDAPKAITLTATTSGTFNGRHFKRVDLSTQQAEPYWLQPDDLLFQRGNTPEYVGMAAIYDGPPNEFIYPDLMMRVRIADQIDLRFVHFWCISPVGRLYLTTNASGAQKTMPKINQKVLRALPIPIPPLAEQHRIVAKVDALMSLSNRLEANLTQADTTRQRLLEALLHEALDPADKELEVAE